MLFWLRVCFYLYSLHLVLIASFIVNSFLRDQRPFFIDASLFICIGTISFLFLFSGIFYFFDVFPNLLDFENIFCVLILWRYCIHLKILIFVIEINKLSKLINNSNRT